MKVWQLIRYLLSPHGKEETMVKVGEAAPEFDAPDHTGKTRRLSEFKGKKVVLWFYPAADTPG
ncbi:MAG: redoxin domain-containing protein [Nitrospirae bacterium]|nr:redoxin domain-containing protein [Nitrospirota bacterium]